MKRWRIDQLRKLEELLGIQFQNMELFHIALLHRSYAHEQGFPEDYEKLEFLGDSVLEFVVTEYLYREYSEKDEGTLSLIKAQIVKESSLAELAKDLCLGELLLLGKGERKTGGMHRKSTLADAFEAVVGAYYLDSGMDTVRRFIIGITQSKIKTLIQSRNYIDYKTQLQVELQRTQKLCPCYTTIKSEGPEHKKKFFVEVSIEERIMGSGSGSNQKSAQQSAARNALINLGIPANCNNSQKSTKAY